MKRLPKSKRMQPVVDFAERHGFTITRTRRGHLRIARPGTTPVFCSSSPSDPRAVKNIMAQLRRVQRGGPAPWA